MVLSGRWWDGKIPSGRRPPLPPLGIFGGQQGTEGLLEVPFDVPWCTLLCGMLHEKRDLKDLGALGVLQASPAAP